MLRRLAGESDESVWSRVPGGEVLPLLDDCIGRPAFYLGKLDRKIHADVGFNIEGDASPASLSLSRARSR